MAVVVELQRITVLCMNARHGLTNDVEPCQDEEHRSGVAIPLVARAINPTHNNEFHGVPKGGKVEMIVPLAGGLAKREDDLCAWSFGDIKMFVELRLQLRLKHRDKELLPIHLILQQIQKLIRIKI